MDHARDDDLNRRIGAIVRSTREETGWGQRELARRLHSSQSAIQRLESGAGRYLDADLASAAFRLLGIRSAFDAQTLGLANRREQRDLVHARCVAYAGRRLKRQDWETRVEVEISAGRSRGWIDLLAYRATDRSLICAEIKTEVDDVGRIQRTIGWYADQAPVASRSLGWRPLSTTVALLILCSAENDRAVRLNLDLLKNCFPGSTRALADWARSPDAPRPAGCLAMIDPLSRRADWLRPSASDGRSSAAPYRDYRAAAMAIRGSIDAARG